jgi:hypothetical protein
MILVLSLALTLLILQGVDAAPVSKGTGFDGEVRPAGQSTPLSSGPIESISGKKRKMESKTVLRDQDLSKTSFYDLVNLRPTRVQTKIDQDLHKHYFANHPEVKRINLSDPDMGKVTAQLVGLSGNGNQGKTWKSRLAACVKDHLEAAPIEKAHKEILLNSVSGQRRKLVTTDARKRWRDKIGEEEIRRRKLAFEDKFKKEHGYRYVHKRRKLEEKDPFLNIPIRYHIGDSLTALQAEKAVRGLASFYSTPRILTKRLEEYLEERKVPHGDFLTAMAIRANTVAQQRIDRTKGKAKEVWTTSVPSWQATSSASHSDLIESIHHPARPSIPPHQKSSSPSSHSQVDIENPEHWKVLRDLLNPPS